MNNVEEKIIAAAIKVYEKYDVEHRFPIIITDSCHSDCVDYLIRKGIQFDWYSKQHLFLTNTNRLVDRREGARIAELAGQLVDFYTEVPEFNGVKELNSEMIDWSK